jgi:hypothetical protein
MQRVQDIGKYGWKDAKMKRSERRKKTRGRRNQGKRKRKSAFLVLFLVLVGAELGTPS